jgi:hypothetical protein
MRAAGRYIWHVGADEVDVQALAARLAEEGLKHRTRSEVEGYGLPSMIRWIMQQKPWEPQEHPAAGLIAKIEAQLHEEGGADPEPEAEPEKEDTSRDLPDFLPVRKDRDAALQEMHDDIANTVAEAWAGAEIRDELELANEAARLEVEERMLAELGISSKEGLTDRQKHKLSREKTKAAKAAVLARYGRDREPGASINLFNGLQGGGKTATVVRKLARRPADADLVVVPTTEKAEEVAEALRKEGVTRAVFVLRGRTKEKEGEPKGGFRMYGQDPELIERAQTQGVNVRQGICKFCPLRDGCDYLAQASEIRETPDRIVIGSHELIFLPGSWFKARTTIIDESVVGNFTLEEHTEPELLFQPGLWSGVPLLEKVARAVRDALEQTGRELEVLRDAGVTDKDLAACAKHLRDRHDGVLWRVQDALATGKPGDWQDALEHLRELAQAAYRPLARIFSNLRREMQTGRAGTNATRRAWVEKTSQEKDGKERRKKVLRYVVNRPRKHRLGDQTSIVLLDGTGSIELNRLVFNRWVNEHRYAVERQGQLVQLTSNTNSKYRLLYRKGASRFRKNVGEMIRHLHTIYGDKLLVGSSMQVEKKLAEDGALEDVLSLHFGAERGVNAAEHCECVLVIGREQPNVAAIEGMARAFMIHKWRPFESVLDDKGEGVLPTFRRRRRMRDGSKVWADVQSHPDPVARLFLEQVREAGIVQMADRIRAVWNPKLIIVATDVPVDLDVNLLVSEGELRGGMKAAAKIVEGLEGRGWHVEVPEPAERGRVEKLVTKSDFCKGYLLQNPLLVTSFRAVLSTTNGKGTDTTVYTSLPPAETIRQAAAEHPGLRMAPPEGGVLALCLERYGMVPAWPDVQRLLPEYLPDAVALKAIKDAERDELRRLREKLSTAAYRVPGRRGPPGAVAFDPARVPDVERTLVAMLGAGVVVEHPPVEETPAAQEQVTMENKKHPRGPIEGRPVAEPPWARRPRPRSGGRRIWTRPWEYRGHRLPDYGPSPADAELIQFARAS